MSWSRVYFQETRKLIRKTFLIVFDRAERASKLQKGESGSSRDRCMQTTEDRSRSFRLCGSRRQKPQLALYHCVRTNSGDIFRGSLATIYVPVVIQRRFVPASGREALPPDYQEVLFTSQVKLLSLSPSIDDRCTVPISLIIGAALII
jgi:hypothetical protein